MTGKLFRTLGKVCTPRMNTELHRMTTCGKEGARTLAIIATPSMAPFREVRLAASQNRRLETGFAGSGSDMAALRRRAWDMPALH